MSDSTKAAVLPTTEFDLVLSIIADYQAQIDAANKSTEEALEKLRKNLKLAESNNIALAAQRKLLETLEQNFKEFAARKAPVEQKTEQT